MTSTIQQTQDRPNSIVKMDLLERGYRYVHLTSLENGHFLLTGTLNGQSGVFLVDTGATTSVLDAARAGEFSLDRQGRRVRIGGIGGGGDARLVRGGRLALENGELDIRRLLIADLGPAREAALQSGHAIDGILGQDVLDRHRAIIDVYSQMLFYRDLSDE